MTLAKAAVVALGGKGGLTWRRGGRFCPCRSGIGCTWGAGLGRGALCPTAGHRAGRIVDKKCNLAIGLGRSLENCLTEGEDYWERFASGKIDIWSLREDTRLVAVLASRWSIEPTSRSPGSTQQDPFCAPHSGHGPFCQAAGISIPDDCEGLLAEYAEWSNAVRIDITDQADPDYHGWPFSIRHIVLSLAFDPALSCAREKLVGRNLPDAVKSFGAERLRKIVQTIAMDETTPIAYHP